MELLHREVFSRDIPWNENTWLGKGMEKIWGWVCWFGSTGSAGHQPPIINFATLWLFQTTQCVCYISSWFKSMLRFLSWRWNVDVCVFPSIVFFSHWYRELGNILGNCAVNDNDKIYSETKHSFKHIINKCSCIEKKCFSVMSPAAIDWLTNLYFSNRDQYMLPSAVFQRCWSLPKKIEERKFISCNDLISLKYFLCLVLLLDKLL